MATPRSDSRLSVNDTENNEIEQNTSLLEQQTTTANPRRTSGFKFTAPRTSTCTIRSWRDSWWQECLSLASAILCLFAIVIILARMNNRLLSSWRSPVSLNATISILSTVFKSLLLFVVANCLSQAKWLHYQKPRSLGDMDVFDDASRGPKGAFFFLIRKRTLMTFATIGAVSTILLLPVDPFTQQLVQLVLRQSPLTNSTTSSFGYATNYDSGAVQNQFSQTNAFAVDLTMQGAVLNGLYNINLQTPFNCPSAECAWNGSFTMLGFQSSCQDVSQKLQSTCDPAGPFNGSVTQTCNLTTPGMITMQTRWVPTDSRTAIVVNATSSPPFVGTPTQVQRDSLTRLVSFAVYRVWDLDTNFQSATPPEAIECQIDLVGKTWSQVSVRNNIFEVGSEQILPLKVNGVSPSSGKTMISLGAVNSSQTFQVNQIDFNSLADFLHYTIFSGSIIEGNNNNNVNGAASFTVAKLYNRSVRISDVAKQITKSMDNRLRTLPNAQIAAGQVLNEQTFVHVRWPFITLHVVIMVACSAFLVITAQQASSRQSMLFKDSSVALLATHTIGWDNSMACLQQGPRRIEEDSEKLIARLMEDESFRIYPRSA